MSSRMKKQIEHASMTTHALSQLAQFSSVMKPWPYLGEESIPGRADLSVLGVQFMSLSSR